MNWLQKTAQLEKQAQKAMPLPKVPEAIPREDRKEHSGIQRLDDMMLQETADMLNQQYPQIEYGDAGGAGEVGVAYQIGPNEMLKITRDWREASIAEDVFYTPMDWVVPILAKPEMIQNNPPLWAIQTKKLHPINNLELEIFVGRLIHIDKTFHIFPNQIMVRSLIKEERIEEQEELAMILYDQIRYIVDRNKETLLLPDIHGGNVGWDDDGVLKVFDLGPGMTRGQIPQSHYP